MSHHFDSPTAIEDGRLNLCDVYAFPGPGATSNLILTVNPDALRSSAATLRPDALYEFVVASDAGTREDRAFRMTFDEPDSDGRQHMTVRYAEGPTSRSGIDGSRLGTGLTGETFRLQNGGSGWFGVVADPFWADGAALFQFMQGLAGDQYLPEALSAAPGNVFAGRNVTAIALQVPNSLFGGDHVTLWARISLYGHAPQRQVSRMGSAMLRPLFFNVPGPDTEALNAGAPVDDVHLHTDRLMQAATKLATLRGLVDPAAHASRVAKAFLPDVLHYRPGRPAGFHPGSGNGRGLHDDSFGTAVSLFNGGPLGITTSPHPVVPEFPHLAPAGTDELPALAELFGLREHVSEAHA